MINFREFREKVHATKKERMHGDRLYRLERNVSIMISYVLSNLFPWIRPNHVSLFAITMFLPALLLATYFTGFWITMAAWAMLKLGTILDRVDGELARYQNYFTQRGIYYDRAYHSFHILAFYGILGASFFGRFDSIEIWPLAFVAAAFSLHYSLMGKLRNHIKYKLGLEGHQSMVSDIVSESDRQKALGMKLLDYLFLRWYDWSWLTALLIIIFSYIYPSDGILVFKAFILASIFYLGFLLFYSYPRRKLFTAAELKQ